jgi:hypothetical protein
MQTGASLHDSRDARYGTRAVTAEKRKAQEAVVAFLFPGKTQERWLCLGGLPAGRTHFVPLCRRKMEEFWQVLEKKWRGRRDSNSRPLP